uniref:Uncharacterized protein n=1 Tax=Macrostomum lignano TaxID=282301 RepID=A0A1I8H724_9PLAT
MAGRQSTWSRWRSSLRTVAFACRWLN